MMEVVTSGAAVTQNNIKFATSGSAVGIDSVIGNDDKNVPASKAVAGIWLN